MPERRVTFASIPPEELSSKDGATFMRRFRDHLGGSPADVVLWHGRDVAVRSRRQPVLHSRPARGVTDAEDNEVLRLFLALQSEYAETGGKWSKRGPTYSGVAAILGLIFSFSPPPIVGIGAGEQRLKAWWRWRRFLFVFILGAILFPFVINILANRVS